MKTKSLKSRFAAMVLAVFPVTAFAVESPVNANFSGEISSIQEKVSYPWAIPGDEGNAPLNVTMNYVTDNSTLTLSQKPSYQGHWIGTHICIFWMTTTVSQIIQDA